MMTIPKSKLNEFIRDMKSMKIKHKPFRKVGNQYEIEFFPNNAILLLRLKYSL